MCPKADENSVFLQSAGCENTGTPNVFHRPQAAKYSLI